MGIIKQLSPHEAQKIAAGQVVDRPANVLKELIENSLDAGATHITVHIENAGKALLRIVDNGSGMDAEDARLCFEKHATSKITHIEQLSHIKTFGFRGEALASIAAVSAVTLLTKSADAAEGIKITAREGTYAAEPTACTPGTDISVRDLFYTMPARAKFLKSPETELRHCMQTIHALCFAHPQISFKVIADGTITLNCPAQETVRDRCVQLWDHAQSHHLLSITGTHEQHGVHITGVISNHEWFRFDRNTIFFLVNNRWVLNQGLSKALTKGFANIIPPGRHPLACIAITVPPTDLDINMHPRKEEVKFAHPRVVESLIEQTVRSALEEHISGRLRRPVSIEKPIPTYQPAQPASPFRYFEEQKPHQLFTATSPVDMPYTAHVPLPVVTSEQQSLPSSQQEIAPQSDLSTSILIGHYHNTYLLIEQQDGLFLIDQHAAHERILYEQFADRVQKISPVTLMFPQSIPCTPEDIALLSPHLTLFHDNGIMIEPFGKDQLIVHATPVPLQHVPIHELVRQVIGWMKESEHVNATEFFNTMHHKLRAQMACKAAIKAGDQLSREQMLELLEKLHKTPNRFSCPHGRPTGLLISLHEIEKKFRRKT